MSDIIGDLFKNEKPKNVIKSNTNTIDVETNSNNNSNYQKDNSKDFSELEKLIKGDNKSNNFNDGIKPLESESKFEEKKDFSKIQNAIKDTKDLNVDSLSNADKETIAKYNQVIISKVKNSPILHYEVPVPKANTSEQEIINTIKEAATRIISLAPYKIRDEKQRWNVYYQKVMEIISSSPELKIPESMQTFYAESVVREMVGFGKIDLLLKDDLLEEIMIIGPNVPVYVFHRQYEMMTTNIVFYTDKEIQDIVGRIARYAGRRIDYSQPLLDARLPDGSRVNATLPPASVLGSTLTIRKFREDPYTIVDLINNGTLDSSVAAFLWLCVEGMGIKPANIVISGGTGSGKTTTLNVLCSLIPEFDRVISIEDTAELNLPLKHWIRLEARPPGIEGTGEISLEMLTKNALRMRPDRIIVGEVRGKEAESLFTAMNTGHDGSLGTLHANSSEETIVRITNPPMDVPKMMLSGLDMIIVQNRLHDRRKGTIRRIVEISEITGVLEDNVRTQKIFEWDPRRDKLIDTSMPSKVLKNISLYSGKSLQQVKDEIENRRQFLELLVDKNIRDKNELIKYIAKYYEK